MNHATTSSFNALLRRPSDTRRVAALLVALVSLVAVLGLSPGVIARRSAASVGEPATVGEPAGAEFRAERVAVASTTTTPASTRPQGPTVVPDPRTGDLRADPTADVLPSGYVAARATDIVSDIAYGPDDAHRLDLYLPAVDDAPVIVYIHHGGWYTGDRAEVPEMVLRFVERGYAVASIDYRLAPEHPFPAPVHDVKRAIRELKVIADETGRIDGESLVLYGISAGGHLAAFAAATVGDFEPTDLTDAQAGHDSSVAGIVVSAGPSDLVQMYSHPHGWAAPMTGDHVGCDPCSDAQLAPPSPVNHVHADVPPAYWAYGELDPLVDAELQGRTIAEAWAAAAGAGSSWLDLVDGHDHVLDETMVNQRALEEFVDTVTAR